MKIIVVSFGERFDLQDFPKISREFRDVSKNYFIHYFKSIVKYDFEQ